MSRRSTALGTFVALALTAAVAPGTAWAGGFDVPACDAGVAGGANNSWGPVASPGMAAYTSCPAGSGLVTRNAYDNGQSGSLEGAYMIFDAPPGTTVDSMSFAAGWQRHNCAWSIGIVASGFDLGGTLIWGFPANQQCDNIQVPGDSFFGSRFSIGVNAPRVRIETRCGAAWCTRNGVAAMRIKDVQVHVRDDTPPTVTNGRGPLWTSNGWLAGTNAVGFDASDGAGIRSASVLLDGQQVAGRSFGCDMTQRAPCPPGGLDANLATRGWSDGSHTLGIQAVDAGGNPATVTRTVRIDNTPPDAPQNLAVEGGEGWRSTNSFNLSWSVVASKVGAGVAGAEWDLCPAGGGKCIHGSKDGAGTSISSLALPAPGEYTLKLWLRDEAGNQDARLAAPPVTLRYDDVSPQLGFEPLTADDPTQLEVDTSDRGSGVGAGQIEMRRHGRDRWTGLATEVQGDKLVARIDDEHLGDGAYELRATAVDRAGNARSTSQLTDGKAAVITLPLRLKTKLRAGIARRRHHRTRLARAAYVRYGQLVRVRGRLTDPRRNPLQDVTVRAYTQVRDRSAPPRLVATVKTSRSGRFSFLVRRGPSRTIRIRYDGARQVRSATRIVLLNVRSRTTFRPSRRRLRNGEVVQFHGRIKTGRIPQQGKLVELQVLLRGRWRTFATTRANRRGRWHFDYRFDGTRGSQVYRFRAKVPPEQGYPFATGRSHVVRVHVSGG